MKFIILDSLEIDCMATWELLSWIKQKADVKDEDELIELAYRTLKELLEEGFITLSEGTTFTGEEKNVDGFLITKEFIINHKDDFKNKSFGDIDMRFELTDLGMQFYLTN